MNAGKLLLAILIATVVFVAIPPVQASAQALQYWTPNRQLYLEPEPSETGRGPVILPGTPIVKLEPKVAQGRFFGRVVWVKVQVTTPDGSPVGWVNEESLVELKGTVIVRVPRQTSGKSFQAKATGVVVSDTPLFADFEATQHSGNVLGELEHVEIAGLVERGWWFNKKYSIWVRANTMYGPVYGFLPLQAVRTDANLDTMKLEIGKDESPGPYLIPLNSSLTPSGTAGLTDAQGQPTGPQQWQNAPVQPQQWQGAPVQPESYQQAPSQQGQGQNWGQQLTPDGWNQQPEQSQGRGWNQSWGQTAPNQQPAPQYGQGADQYAPYVPTAEPPQVQSMAASSSGGINIPWMPETVTRWSDLIIAAAKKHGVDPALVAIVMLAESGGNPSARSGSGAAGLMQVMPNTGVEIAGNMGVVGFDIQNLYDPETAIDFGAYYLAKMLGLYGLQYDSDWQQSVERAAVAYNGGPGTAMSWINGKINLPNETERYKRWVGGMWSERHNQTSPTFDAWMAAGGGALVQSARSYNYGGGW